MQLVNYIHVDVHLSFFICPKIVAQLYENSKGKWFAIKLNYLLWSCRNSSSYYIFQNRAFHGRWENVERELHRCRLRIYEPWMMHLIWNGCTFCKHVWMQISKTYWNLTRSYQVQTLKMKVKNVPFAKLCYFHFRSLVECNIGSGLAKSSWGSIFLISSISLPVLFGSCQIMSSLTHCQCAWKRILKL